MQSIAIDFCIHEWQDVTVHINGRTEHAKAATGMFAVADGGFCLSQRGSSGWPLPGGLKREFCEVIKRGGNAAKAFGKPPGGTPVQWTPAHV